MIFKNNEEAGPVRYVIATANYAFLIINVLPSNSQQHHTSALPCFRYTFLRKVFEIMNIQNKENNKTAAQTEQQFLEQQILHELEKINENLKNISDSFIHLCTYGILKK